MNRRKSTELYPEGSELESPKRIALIYDNTDRPDTTGGYCKRALDHLAEITHYLPTQLNEIPSGFDLYLNIDDGIRYLLPTHLHPSAWWVIDTHLQYEWDLQKARTFDYVFAAQKDGAEQLKADGVHDVTWLPLACDPKAHRRHDVPLQHDVCFVGIIYSGAREELLQLIRDNFDNIFIGRAFFDEMARKYSASKIVFNRSIRNDVNMRVFEALACGSLLVTNNLDENGMAELFTGGEHLVTYHDGHDLLKKLRYYLEHDEERERIALQGQTEVLQHHTYLHRMRMILDTCFGPLTGRAMAVPGGSSLDEVTKHLEPDKSRHYSSYSRPEVAKLVPATARRILDVGCGAGHLGASLKARGNTEVVGIEIDPTVASAAETKLDRVLVLDLNELDTLPFPEGYFDCMVFADVLEHLMEPNQVLVQLRRYLNPAGSVVIRLPNIRHYTVMKPLLVHGKWDYQEAGILDRTHVRFFTWDSVQTLLSQAGMLGEVAEPVLVQDDPAVEPLLKAVAQAGGDVEQARLEFQTYQFLLRARPKPLTVSIVILTLNNLSHTRLCLDSIARYTPAGTYELIIVDNGSSDGTLAFLREYAATNPHVRVIVNSENRGFAAGNNQGLALAKAEYVLLLNNDTIVTEGWLTRMLGVFQRHPEAGIVGPMSNHTIGPQCVRNAAYSTLEELSAFARQRATEHDGQSEPILRIVGFCLMARRRVIETIGGLDERFGNGNYEDDDFYLRAAHAGFHSRMAKDVFIHHTGGQTFVSERIEYSESVLHNWKLLKAKWGLPADAQMERGYHFPKHPPFQALDPIRLPDLNADHTVDSEGRWWQPGESPGIKPQVSGNHRSAAVETLETLLNSDDLAASLQEHEDGLDADLLALVLSNAGAARADGDTDLAEGLGGLAAYIGEVIQ